MFTNKIYKSKNHHYYAVDIMGDKHKATEIPHYRTGCKAFKYHINNYPHFYVIDVVTKNDVVMSENITEEVF